MNIANKFKSILYFTICRLGFHKWEITKWSSFKDKKCKYLFEEGFSRDCEYCGKEQTLKRPKKYHPTKYLWADTKK
tara:strand:+ start:37 stop:264 length:228 start_codon:yes stop_codon:yes gene_type:complete